MISNYQHCTAEIINNKILNRILRGQTERKITSNNKTHIQKILSMNNTFISPQFHQYRQYKSKNNGIPIMENIIIKKQLLSHRKQPKSQFKDAMLFDKTKSSFINTKSPTIRDLKRGNNISGILKAKKKQKQKIIDQLFFEKDQNNVAKFYVKPGEKPIQYELKMQIKKCEKNIPPKQRSFRTKFTCQQFQRKVTVSQNQHRKPFNFNEIQLPQDKQDKTNISTIRKNNFVTNSNTQPIKQRYQNRRSLKSSLILNLRHNKNNKKTISNDEDQKLYHIQKIIQNTDQCDEQLTDLVHQKYRFEEQCCKLQQIQQYISQNSLIKQLSAECINVSYLNYTKKSIQQIFVKNEQRRVQIASITKIMTCYLILNIAKKFRIDIHKQKLLVGKNESSMPGTSAKLMYSDIITIYQALHGLMLPSGNDAAVALAHWGGKIIRKYCDIGKNYLKLKEKQTKSCNYINQLLTSRKSFQKLFIFHMNKTAQLLQLHNTNFMNPHGLMSSKSYSTASDIVKLVSIAFQDKIFREITGKKSFSCKIFNRTYSQTRLVQWKNTNKLLEIDGFRGTKTGVTPTAGPCLSSIYQLSKDQYIVILLLKVKSMEERFRQSVFLLKQFLPFINKQKHSELLLTLKSFKQSVIDDFSNNITIQEESESANMIPNAEIPDVDDDDDDQNDQDEDI